MTAPDHPEGKSVTRKTRLTPADHAELGAVLAGIRDELLQRSVQVANAYPQASTQAKELDAAVQALDRARSALDSALATEDPDGFDTHVYYPDAEDRARVVGST